MGISEILRLEANSSGQVILLREGIFWRAYERSAYLFTTHVKPYQLTKRYFKNVGCEVVSPLNHFVSQRLFNRVNCGFPNTNLEVLLAKVSIKEVVREDNKISIAGFDPIENEVFTDWKNGIPNIVKEGEAAYPVSGNGCNSKEVVLQSLRNFWVASSTPLEQYHSICYWHFKG